SPVAWSPTRDHSGHMPVVSVLQRSDDYRNGARGVAWRDIKGGGDIAKAELLTVRDDHVFLRLEISRIIRPGNHVPILFRQQKARMIVILKKFASAVYLGFAGGKQDIFNLRRIET